MVCLYTEEIKLNRYIHETFNVYIRRPLFLDIIVISSHTEVLTRFNGYTINLRAQTLKHLV